MSRDRCPESADGGHDPLTDVHGRCLFCGAKIDSPAYFSPNPAKRHQRRRAQDPLSIDPPDEADYLDGWD